jgi:hypothetical protein
MAPPSSSHDLHPEHGARFVLSRVGPETPVRYRVQVFLPDDLLESALRWDDEGAARLEPPLADLWVHDEALKLARVLKRDPRPEMTRWRGR